MQLTDDEILEKCTKYLDSNNSIMVEWFIRVKLGIQNPNLAKRIYIRILQSDKYIEKGDQDQYRLQRIVFNPNYKKSEWHERHYWTAQIFTGFIVATFSLLVGYILYRLDTQNKAQEYKELKNQLQVESKTLDSLTSLPVFHKK